MSLSSLFSLSLSLSLYIYIYKQTHNVLVYDTRPDQYGVPTRKIVSKNAMLKIPAAKSAFTLRLCLRRREINSLSNHFDLIMKSNNEKFLFSFIIIIIIEV